MLLSVLIFVDGYFNWHPTRHWSVMRRRQTGIKYRAKLSYIIDASSSSGLYHCANQLLGSGSDLLTSIGFRYQWLRVFLQTIPYNLYAILTLVMLLGVTLLRVDFGPMAVHERNAIAGDLLTTIGRPYEGNEEEIQKENAHVLDLVLPVVVLISSCIIAMIYTGGFFDGASFVDAFASSDASVGLVLGGAVTLVFTFIYYMMRDTLSFQEFTECIPDGFRSMIAPILILTMAWTLSGMTNLLGAKVFVADLV